MKKFFKVAGYTLLAGAVVVAGYVAYNKMQDETSSTTEE